MTSRSVIVHLQRGETLHGRNDAEMLIHETAAPHGRLAFGVRQHRQKTFGLAVTANLIESLVMLQNKTPWSPVTL